MTIALVKSPVLIVPKGERCAMCLVLLANEPGEKLGYAFALYLSGLGHIGISLCEEHEENLVDSVAAWNEDVVKEADEVPKEELS